MKHNYTALDSAILEALSSGATTFRSIESYTKVKINSDLLARANNANVLWHNRKDGWQFIEERLHDLKKKGQIEFIDQARGWALKEQA